MCCSRFWCAPQADKRDAYELVAGERRWRASQLAGLTEIPALIRSMTEQESLAVALVENLQREDLNAMEEAKGLFDLQDRFGLSQEKLANYVGKSRSAVANTLRLLQLPDDMQTQLSDGELSAGHARGAYVHNRPHCPGKNCATAFWRRECPFARPKPRPPIGRPTVNCPRMAEQKKAAVKKDDAGQAGKDVTEALNRMEDNIAQTLGVRVKCSGNASKGRISLYFTTEEERDALMQALTQGVA